MNTLHIFLQKMIKILLWMRFSPWLIRESFMNTTTIYWCRSWQRGWGDSKSNHDTIRTPHHLFHLLFVVIMCMGLSFINFRSSNGILSLIFLNIGNVEFFWCHGWLLDHLDFYVSICTSILWLYSWIRVKISFTIVLLSFSEWICVECPSGKR